MHSPLVSIVIPVFNGMPYLAEAYEAITTQTYPNLEIVFVDGGSSDDSIAWLKALDDPRARVEYLPKGTPAAVTWTTATEAATGDFVKLLCQDDLIHADAIEKQVADLLAHPETAMAVAQRDVVSASGKVLYRHRGCAGLAAGPVAGPDALRAAFARGTNVFGEPLAVLFRREPLLAAMPWSDARPFLLDLDTYTAVLQQPGASVVVRKESIGAFRVSTSSWSTRLVRSHRSQFRQWQDEYQAAHRPSAVSAARANVGLRFETQLRRTAYAWLRFRHDL